MTGHKLPEFLGAQDTGFEELEEAGLILRPSCLQGDRRQMLGAEDPRGDSTCVQGDRLVQGFLDQRRGGGKELYGPIRKEENQGQTLCRTLKGLTLVNRPRVAEEGPPTRFERSFPSASNQTRIG